MLASGHPLLVQVHFFSGSEVCSSSTSIISVNSSFLINSIIGIFVECQEKVQIHLCTSEYAINGKIEEGQLGRYISDLD